MEGYKCDTCGEFKSTYLNIMTLFTDSVKVPNKYHFCNFQCLLKYVKKELKKQNKEDRFIYGEGEK